MNDDTTIPTRFKQIFRFLNPQGFNERFILWTLGRMESFQRVKVIAIDEKILCGSADNAIKALSVHVVRAFAT